MEFYIDANNHVLGRLASKIAKALLKGDKVFVVNAEKVAISGNPKIVLEGYKEKIARGDPYHGPFFPKIPDRILKRTVRGMLPKSPRGGDALKRLTVFISIPDEMKDKKFEAIKEAEDNLSCKSITLGKVCEQLIGKKF